MDCISCGGPLDPKSNVCKFCGTLNDMDLRALHQNYEKGAPTERICPLCDVPLHSLNLGGDEDFVIERCEKCLGLFFDPNELEVLVDSSVSHVYTIDRERMAKLIEEEGAENPRPVSYIKCPVCRRLMNRRVFGVRSGVAVDVCREHGIWLDAGELGRILKWAKAGGLIHTREKEKERKRAASRKQSTPSTAFGGAMWDRGPEVDLCGWGLLGLIRLILSLLR
jgi:Zn-finger nucleic acid-binding protein